MRRALWILAVLLSHWRRHKMQLATLLIGLISATALWSGVQALNQQARESYDRAAAVFGGARTAALVARAGGTFPQELFIKLRRAGWQVSPVLEGRVQLGGRSLRLLGIEPVTLPVDVGNAPTLGRDGLQNFILPPGQTLVAPDTLADLALSEGATPDISGGERLPPLHVQRELVGDVLVVDIGIAQALLHKPNEVSRLLVGKPNGPVQPLETVVGDQLRLVQPDAETDLERLTDSFHLNLTAFGLLSFVVGLFIVNSAIGLAFEQRLPMLRTLRACGASAVMLNGVLVIELVSLALVAGVIGLVCGYFIAAALLPDVAASLARALRRADSGRAVASPGMVDRGARHQRRRRAGRGGHQPRQGDPAAAACNCAAAGLAAGTAPLADAAERGGARHLRGRLLAAAGTAIRCSRDLPCSPPSCSAPRCCCLPSSKPRSCRRTQRARRAGAVVLGRQPPTALGALARADGAPACARGQCRRRHHGRDLQPHVC